MILMWIIRQHHNRAERTLACDRYQKVFDTATIALFEIDCLNLRKIVPQIAAENQNDLNGFIEAHSEKIEDLLTAFEVIDANPAALRMLKAPNKKALVDALPDLYLPETKIAFKQFLTAIDSGQPRFECETTLRCMDGQVLNALISLTLPSDPEAYQSLIVSLVDISDRFRSQEALSRSEERFRMVFNNSASGMALMDSEGNYLRVNQALCNMLGYNEEELSQKNWRDVTHPDDISTILEANRRMLQGFASFPIESRHINRQGHIIWTLLNVARIVDQKNEPPYYIAQVQDISTLRNARAKLRQKEERYRQIFEADLSGFYIINPEGVLLMCNHVFAKMLGYAKAEDILGENIKIFYRDQTLRSQLTAELSNAKKVIQREVEFVNKDGSPMNVLINAVGRFDERGRLLEIQGYLMDITQQKNLEAQLLQAQKMESIGTMAGGVAHDFNNLLMGIMGNTALLKTKLSPSHPEFSRLKSIEEYIQSGSSLTRQLLGFAKGGKYETRTMNINRLIQRNIKMFARTHKEIRVQTKLAGNLYLVDADQSQIDQVLYNLYVNAQQAMEKSGNLRIQTKNINIDPKTAKLHGVQPGIYIQIAVTDTGVGISADIQQRIFDPFFTTKERGRGTGLGLASAYGIIKNHAGFMSVHSREGAGATFFIHLPASRKSLEESIPPEPAFHETTAAHHNGTILLVDDEAVIIEAVGDMISHLGYRLEIARSGEKALELYQANQGAIDLVILDLVMPSMGGAETFDKLKTMDPQVKVLLCSGFSAEGQATELLQRGCLGFIQKPFNLNQFAYKLGRVLNKETA
jgi:PAS domain S-box-containing protein